MALYSNLGILGEITFFGGHNLPILGGYLGGDFSYDLGKIRISC